MKFYWLLLTVSYGLVNANSKRQTASDDCLYRYGLMQLPGVPQLSHMMSIKELVLVAGKVVDDILISASILKTKHLVEHIRSWIKLRTIRYGRTSFEFYECKISQVSDMSFTVSSEMKLENVVEASFDRVRRK